MAKEAVGLQLAYSKCQKPLDTGDSLFVQEVGDRRPPYLDFLQHHLLTKNSSDAKKPKENLRGSLFKRGINHVPLSYIVSNEAIRVLKEAS